MKYIFESYNSGHDLPDDPFHPFSHDEWAQCTPTQMMTHLVQHLQNPLGPDPIPSGPISSPRPTSYSTAAIELMGFKKGYPKRNYCIPFTKRGTMIASVEAYS